MRRFIFYLLSLAVSLGILGIPLSALAAKPAQGNKLTAACNGSVPSSSAFCTDINRTTNPLAGSSDSLIEKVVKLVALFGGVVAVFVLMIGGMMYVLSGGDSGKTSKAKDTILYALVGLVIIVIGRTIIVFVIGRL